MPYKISGSINDSARIIVIDESGWTIDSNTEESPSSFEVIVDSGSKLVIGRRSDGEILAFGGIDAIMALGDRGVFAGGYDKDAAAKRNIIDYITITSTGNASNFGDLSSVREAMARTMNA